MKCLLLSNQKNDNLCKFFTYLTYTDVNTIDWSYTHYFDYTLVLNSLVSFRCDRLQVFLKYMKPNFAAKSTYWGIGFPYIGIFSNSTCKLLKKSTIKELFNDPLENLFANIFMQLNNIDSISRLLSIDPEENHLLCYRNRVSSIDKYCYTQDHDSDQYIFYPHAIEKQPKYKQVWFDKKTHKVELGKNFIITNGYHIAVLDLDTIVNWDNTIKQWIPSTEHIRNLAINYLHDHNILIPNVRDTN